MLILGNNCANVNSAATACGTSNPTKRAAVPHHLLKKVVGVQVVGNVQVKAVGRHNALEVGKRAVSKGTKHIQRGGPLNATKGKSR